MILLPPSTPDLSEMRPADPAINGRRLIYELANDPCP
jgi:hypothetical protein